MESYVDKLLDLRLPCLEIPPAVAVVLQGNQVAGRARQVHMSEQMVGHIVVDVGLDFQTVGSAVDLDMNKAVRWHPTANDQVVVQIHNALPTGVAKDRAFGLN